MMSRPLARELERQARAGASLTVRADHYVAYQLEAIARATAAGGGTLIITNATRLLAYQRDDIERACPGRVLFDNC